jgi:hypothetical protein
MGLIKWPGSWVCCARSRALVPSPNLQNWRLKPLSHSKKQAQSSMPQLRQKRLRTLRLLQRPQRLQRPP